MHKVSIRRHIIDRLVARSGDVHWFDRLDAAKTALLVIDMQNTFCMAGAPAEVPRSRDIVPNINRLAARLRTIGVPIIWVIHANSTTGGRTDWEVFFNHVVRNPDVRRRMAESLSPSRQEVWQDLERRPEDPVVVKNRYSALAHGSSSLERVLRNLGVDTVLVAGTKTNVCCDSTARDAMMLDFKAVLLSDCCAALSDEEHLASLETFIQQFGDVMTADEALARLEKPLGARKTA
jgi:ureidoacrylate peracid hydrolase